MIRFSRDIFFELSWFTSPVWYLCTYYYYMSWCSNSKHLWWQFYCHHKI